MPNPIQKCTDAITRLNQRQVTGQAAFIRAQAIRELEAIRDAMVKKVDALNARCRRLEAKVKETV